ALVDELEERPRGENQRDDDGERAGALKDPARRAFESLGQEEKEEKRNERKGERDAGGDGKPREHESGSESDSERRRKEPLDPARRVEPQPVGAEAGEGGHREYGRPERLDRVADAVERRECPKPRTRRPLERQQETRGPDGREQEDDAAPRA